MFMDQPFNPAAFAHEFAHLWWGNHIGLEGRKGDFLLDEGLAQYGSMVAADRVLGTAAGSAYRRRGIPGFNESLYSALGYLKIQAAGLDRPLLALEDDGLSYWIAYSKAGLAWYALAEDMGRPNFRAALQAIAKAHGAATVTWDEFVVELQRHSRRPLAPAIDAWFAAPGAPEYALEWRRAGGSIHGRILSFADAKPATLEVEVRFTDGRQQRRRVRVRQGPAAFRLPAGRGVAAVVLDPDYKVLRWTPELRVEAEAMAQYMRGLVLARLGRKDEAEKVLQAILADRPGDRRFDRILLTHASLLRLADERGCRPCAISHLQAALATAPQRLAPLAPTYLGLALAARRLERNDLAARAAALAVKADALVGNANGAAARLEAPAAPAR
jgi:tetratricopeptide (TPR) repeat protein